MYLSSMNLKSFTDYSPEEHPLVYREKSSEEKTYPWGRPVLMVLVGCDAFSVLTCCLLVVI